MDIDENGCGYDTYGEEEGLVGKSGRRRPIG
jgi:hypothetical protein